ncbi:DoxX family protein [Kordiimonas sp.]|uniref:DoxX family protein n=1 Tax=Kordiimonas sp. TaxID=1970157 RepID=UPI003A95B62D
MNIFLWVLQGLLALHTAIGAAWKFNNSEQAVPSLNAIPHGVWMGMSVVELLCAVGLVVPAFYKPLAFLAPYGAILIAAEMLAFCAIHLASGDNNMGPMVYWIIVAAICAFIAYGRFVLSPFS